jgi:hypothetical protein
LSPRRELSLLNVHPRHAIYARQALMNHLQSQPTAG